MSTTAKRGAQKSRSKKGRSRRVPPPAPGWAYGDEIITITLCRGELAATLGERGLMVRNWSKLAKALERALRSETPSRGDGHTGSTGVGDMLLNRAIEQTGETFSGLDSKPDSGPNECWPFGKAWFDGPPNKTGQP